MKVEKYMVQFDIAGQTSYQNQSLKDIVTDINHWQGYVREINNHFSHFIVEHYNRISKLPFDARRVFEETVQTSATFIGDFEIIKSHIETGNITEQTVTLLSNIGEISYKYNENYGKAWHRNVINYEENEDIYRNLYCFGRDCFVTLQDAVNASERLKHYIKTQPVNLTQNIYNASGNNIQQGTQASMTMSNYNNDLKEINELIDKLKSEIKSNEASDQNLMISELIEAVYEEVNKEKPKKQMIKTLLSSLKNINNVSADFMTNVDMLMQLLS